MIGTILGSRYEIVEKIGEGGMAEVYKAKCHLLNRFVAVKVLKEEFMNNEEFLDKFNREAAAAAGLSGTNIVNIYDVGNERNINYIVMEYVDGKTLKEIVRSRGKLNFSQAIDIGIQIAKALECAHKNNIIHRDIKPHNILVTEEGIVKVTDFGIAKASNSNTITNTSKVMGSAHYFSPEQAKASYVDCRTDIYSLGIVMYEMVTGRVPYDAETPVSVALKHIQEAIIPPKELNTMIPSGLNNLILKSVEKEPIKRYQTIKELLTDLQMIQCNYNYDIVKNDFDDGFTKIMDPVFVDEDRDLNHKKDKNIRNINKEGKNSKNKRNSGKKIGLSIIVFVLILAVGMTAGYGYRKFFGLSGENNVEVVIPNVVGLTEIEAKEKITDLGLNFVVGQEEESDEPKGKILRTFPEVGSKVKSNTDVSVSVSNGPKQITVRDFRGQDKITTMDIIKNDGLRVGTITEEFSDTVAKSQIIDQSPEGGTPVDKNSSVDLIVSKGPEIKFAVVPNLIDHTLQEAETLLELSKLKLGTKNEILTDKTELDGLIFSQTIAEGTEVKEDVEINVSYYKYDAKEVKRIDVPNFVGKTVKEAKDMAEELGINIEVYGEDENIIDSQDKEEGSKIYIGDSVKLTVVMQ